MLTELELENFKGFGERQRVPLAPLTLIFGGNSAGKSSLIQALLLMRQSTADSERGPIRRGRGVQLQVRGELTDLGSFDALIHRHERDRQLVVGWSSSISGPSFGRDRTVIERNTTVRGALTFERTRESASITHAATEIGGARFVRYEASSSPNAAEAEIWADSRDAESTLVTSAQGTVSLFLTALDATVFHDDQDPLAALQQNDREVARLCEELLLWDTRVVAQTIAGLPVAPLAYETVSGYIEATGRRGESLFVPDEMQQLNAVHRVISMWLEATSRVLRRSIGSVQYLGPMRKAPERLNVLSGEAVSGTGVQGERVVDLLARREGVLREVNHWFRILEIPYTIDIRAVNDDILGGAIGEVHCLLLKDRQGVEVAPTDVGFGIGQVLPVIVQACLTENSTLCIEQPEIHLHPALQARLAELFVKRAAGRSGRQFILETHSEHFLLRVQRMVRRKQISPDQVSVLYVGADDGVSYVKRLRIDPDGDFRDEWPGGFFDERFEELFGD